MIRKAPAPSGSLLFILSVACGLPLFSRELMYLKLTHSSTPATPLLTKVHSHIHASSHISYSTPSRLSLGCPGPLHTQPPLYDHVCDRYVYLPPRVTFLLWQVLADAAYSCCGRFSLTATCHMLIPVAAASYRSTRVNNPPFSLRAATVF